MIAFNFIGSIFGLLETHLTRQPGPGSTSTLKPSKEYHIPPEARNCLDTTILAPAVPRNFIKSVSGIFCISKDNIINLFGKKDINSLNIDSVSGGAKGVRSLLLIQVCVSDKLCPIARPLRIEFDGALYHVTSRGNAREPIFITDEKRVLFLDILKKTRDL